MNAVLDRISELVSDELKAANDVHEQFHSAHEGYAVLLEEVEEAQAELDALISWMHALWKCIKMNADKTHNLAVGIESRAIHLAAEAIQVAAMARKMQAMRMTAGEAENENDSR